jgi:DNA helicase-2/ATP-dependent DNA helicase PcrA
MKMGDTMIRAVLFDMDGTLIDTEKYYRVFWPKAMAEFGYHMTDEQVLSMRSLGRPFAPARLKEWFGEELDYYAVRARRTEMMEAQLDVDGIQLKPGAVEILEELRRRGILAAVATATPPERTEKYLGLTGIRPYFSKIISATQVKEGKPSPDIYLYACEQLGLAPEECMAVEDAPNGILAAYRAGLRVVMVPDQTQPTEELQGMLYTNVDRLDDLTRCLD